MTAKGAASGYEHEQEEVRVLYRQLLKTERKAFPDERKPLDAPTARGVYVIYDPNGTVLHVGSTPRARGGIRQRLQNHLAGRSSFTQSHFKRSKKRGPQLRNGYKFRCLAVNAPRIRALLEAYAIGSLCPLHIGHGQD